MRFLSRCVLAAAVAVGVGSAAVAQPPGGGRGGFGGGMFGGGLNVYTLVATNKALQDEVKVTDEQKTKLEAALKPIQEEQDKAFPRPMAGGGGQRERPTEEQMKERAEKMAKFNDERKKAVAGVLSADQTKRLSQIGYQAMGVAAFNNKDVQAGLKLDDGQKEKIKGIADEYTKDSRELMQGAFQRGGGGGGDREEMQKRMAEMNKKREALTKDATDKIEGVLTAEQKTAWKGMVGEKFDTSKLMQMPGGRRGGV